MCNIINENINNNINEIIMWNIININNNININV